MPYHPMPEHPWETREAWVIAWWNDEYDCWAAASGPCPDREEAVRNLAKRRATMPDLPLRLIRETSVYTAEED